MPPINIYRCDSCVYKLHQGWGGDAYVEDEYGERIACQHPFEIARVCEVVAQTLKITPHELAQITNHDSKWWWSKERKQSHLQKRAHIRRLISERTGFNQDCICLSCTKTCALDLGDHQHSPSSWQESYGAFTSGAVRQKDKRICPHCGSEAVMTVFEMIGQECPICHKGTIIEEVTGEES